jgi:hypothetical protein
MDKIFSMRTQQKLRINDLSTVDISEILDNTYSTIVINCETSENNVETVNLIFNLNSLIFLLKCKKNECIVS